MFILLLYIRLVVVGRSLAALLPGGGETSLFLSAIR